MKSRLAGLAVIAVLSSLLVALTGVSAEAAGVSARLSRSTPIAGESVRIYGAVPKKLRYAKLQAVSHGRWVGMRGGHTNRGRFTFAVPVGRSAVKYRVVAAKSAHKRPSRASRPVVVRGVLPRITFAPPVSLRGKTFSPASAIVSPARPGATVRLLKRVGSRYVTAKLAKQNGAGVVKFSVPTGSAAAPIRYQAQAVNGRRITTAPSALSVPLSSTALAEEFSGTRLSSKWTDRGVDAGYLPTRKCSKTMANMVTVGGGVSSFKIRRIGSKAGCRYGTWANPAITTGNLSQPYGFYTARIKFQQSRGMHAAFWLKGGSEIDVAEHFGYHRPISNLIHNGTQNTGNFSVGGDQPQTRTILGRSTPYSGYHVYSVLWSPAGYVFMLDGVPTLVTDRKNTKAGAEVILSLQTSDWELPALNPRTVSSAASSMRVDYVRAWQ